MDCLRLRPTRRARLSLEQLGRLQIYLVAYVAVALLVSLWVLPGLVAALTPIRARDVLGESRDALITAFIAGDLFIVLPGLMQASRTLLDRLDPGDDGAGPADGGHRAGLLQLPAHREAALPELRALRGMVRRRAGAAVGLSAAGARRARDASSAASPRPCRFCSTCSGFRPIRFSCFSRPASSTRASDRSWRRCTR